MGHRADVVHMNALNPNLIDNYQVVSFSRPTYSRSLREFLGHCEKQNILAIADYDDLTFDPRQANQTPQAVNKQAPVSTIRTKMNNNLKGLRLFRAVTFATTRLLEQAYGLMENDVRAQVIANGLSNHWVSNYAPKHGAKRNPRKIAYLSGSSSHDRDFATIEDTLLDFLEGRPDFILEVTGKLSVNKSKFRSRQLFQAPSVPYELLPSVIHDSSVSLAPLADSVFNECKSHIKFIEAAAFGVPSICTPIPDISRHSCEGLLPATSPLEWSKALNLASIPDFMHDCSETLKNYVQDHCMNRDNAKVLLDFLTESNITVQRNTTDRIFRMSA